LRATINVSRFLGWARDNHKPSIAKLNANNDKKSIAWFEDIVFCIKSSGFG
jgi:hypothetical protein